MTTPSMIERVSAAISDAMCPVEGYAGTSNEALARAAIEAMRDATPEMIEAGRDANGRFRSFDEAFAAMIDRALDTAP